jgi:hypothetical protein
MIASGPGRGAFRKSAQAEQTACRPRVAGNFGEALRIPRLNGGMLAREINLTTKTCRIRGPSDEISTVDDHQPAAVSRKHLLIEPYTKRSGESHEKLTEMS